MTGIQNASEGEVEEFAGTAFQRHDALSLKSCTVPDVITPQL
jgi:hypothetical protein